MEEDASFSMEDEPPPPGEDAPVSDEGDPPSPESGGFTGSSDGAPYTGVGEGPVSSEEPDEYIEGFVFVTAADLGFGDLEAPNVGEVVDELYNQVMDGDVAEAINTIAEFF